MNLHGDLQGDLPPLQFSRFVGYPDLPMSKTLKVVGLLNVMIFFQSEKFTACKIKDEKDTVIMFNLLKIITPFETCSKKIG